VTDYGDNLSAIARDVVADASPQRSRVRHVPYNREAIDLIAETLGVVAGHASFRLPNATVYQLVVPGQDERPAAMVTLWPSIRRVDVIGTQLTVVYTDVVGVELVDQIEVIFRRRGNEMLIVTRGGKVIVRA
jgi:hypothetical protein